MQQGERPEQEWCKKQQEKKSDGCQNKSYDVQDGEGRGALRNQRSSSFVADR